MQRSRITPVDLTNIEHQRFDLIVIGAGVNGAGIARDAAMRGLRVLVLDKDDISSGTTSWSTRLIHGGLRYLEYYEVPLVRESLRERERLLHIAPHLVKPLRFIIPIYAWNKRGPSLIRLGMVAYDVLSYDRSLEGHRMLSPFDALRMAPGLNPDDLRGAALYYDAQVTFPERLAVENALSARDYGATVVTYARVDELLISENDVKGVRATDLFSGRSFTARAPVTVNVAGPWVDEVLGTINHPRMIGGTKGSHIVVDTFPGAPQEALYVEAADGRPYFIVPWNGLYLIGTTDLHYDGDLDVVVPTEEEIDYLIASTNRLITEAGLTREDVLYVYAGVRPLPYEPDAIAGSITRSYIVHDHAPEYGGLISIVGGKLTTYRNLAEQTVDLALKKLRRPWARCRTLTTALPGANTADWGRFAANFGATSGLDDARTSRLLHVYGVFASQVLKLVNEDLALAEPIGPTSGALAAEVVFALRREQAETLGDVLLRRTMVGLERDAGLEAVEKAAAIAHRYAGWDEQRASAEVEAYYEYVERLKPRGLASVPRARNEG